MELFPSIFYARDSKRLLNVFLIGRFTVSGLDGVTKTNTIVNESGLKLAIEVMVDTIFTKVSMGGGLPLTVDD